MGRLNVFIHLTVDGFFAGPDGQIDWFKAIAKDEQYEKYTHAQSQGGGSLVFGRTTYEMMKSYWPTPAAISADPDMARVVNHSPKIVFSRKLKSVEEGPNWKNIRLLHEIEPAGVRELKAEARGDLTVLGSGSVVRQLANLGLVDEYCLVVVPIVLGAGKRLFEDFREGGMELLESRAFGNGLVVQRYRPA
jgi:dihydrofolate reductase